MNKTKSTAIKYPTYYVCGEPTPCEELRICDICGKAEWTTAGGYSNIVICNTHNGKPARMRIATQSEKNQALDAVQTIIGDKQRFPRKS
jgi:hypothetical protein